MKCKKLISLLLFLVLSIQILPLERIAAWLSSGQITEEIAHNVNPVKAKSGLDESHHPFTLHALHADINSFITSSLLKHHQDEALFIRHADDILTPPPNDSFL